MNIKQWLRDGEAKQSFGVEGSKTRVQLKKMFFSKDMCGGGGLVAKLCPNLVTPMDCSLPGSSVHGILQARILEWVAISFSRVSLIKTNHMLHLKASLKKLQRREIVYRIFSEINRDIL